MVEGRDIPWYIPAMASLYIKDTDTAERVTRVAKRSGMTKTALVRDMTIAREAEMDRADKVRPRRPAREILEELWRKHPLGEPTGLEADKAFYDSLNDEDED